MCFFYPNIITSLFHDKLHGPVVYKTTNVFVEHFYKPEALFQAALTEQLFPLDPSCHASTTESHLAFVLSLCLKMEIHYLLLPSAQ